MAEDKIMLEGGLRRLSSDEIVPPPPSAPDAEEPLAVHGLMERRSYEAPIAFAGERDFTPLNPRGRTGMNGRGLLGKWGPNHAADPIVTRLHPQTNQLQMVAIERSDTEGIWAIPGGFVDEGEHVSATVMREFIEEAGVSRLLSTQRPCALARRSLRRVDKAYSLCVRACVYPQDVKDPDRKLQFDAAIRELFQDGGRVVPGDLGPPRAAPRGDFGHQQGPR